ncbi:MAG: hypothetical protein RL219_1448 [Actinomycetota bacterium]
MGRRENPTPACLSCRIGSVARMPDETADGDAETRALDELARARERLLAEPPHQVVVNHAIGLYELGALHLTASPADLGAAALAIDAMACLVEGLSGRLGPDEDTLRDALANIRLAFVQIKGSAGD